jgi:flagellar M-ring protein FliF
MTALRFAGRRRTTVGVVAVLLLWPLAASTAFASTGPMPGSDRAAAVQTVLDRVLGPGNSTVVVADTIRTSTAATTSVRWGSGVAASLAANTVVTPGGTSVATSRQNLVGGTTTVVATPAGALVDESVSVVVDRAHLGGTSLATLQRLVAATAGVVPSRGDRVSVIVARFARPTTVAAAVVSPATLLMPYAVPALWALGAIVALAIVAAAVRGGRRPARTGTDVQRI